MNTKTIIERIDTKTFIKDENTKTLILGIGDIEHIGHRKVHYFVVRSNTPKEEIKEAYLKGIRTIGFALSKNEFNIPVLFNVNIDDDRVTWATVQKFLQYGASSKWFVHSKFDYYVVSPENIANLFMFIASGENPNIKYNIKPLDYYIFNSENIGYGTVFTY